MIARTATPSKDVVLLHRQTSAARNDSVGQAGSLRPSGTRPACLSADTSHLWLRLCFLWASLFTGKTGGLPTRRRLTICPTSARVLFCLTYEGFMRQSGT